MRTGPLREALARLEGLTAVVEDGRYQWEPVPIDDWIRPHGLLRLHGQGFEGLGELVAFELPTHEALAGGVAAGTYRVDAPPGDDPYTRCCWQAAILDLALRQRGLSMSQVFAAPARVPLSIVWSFAQPPADPPGPLKLDRADADTPNLRVLDFKGVGHSGPAGVIFEDPDAPVRAPWSLDQSMRSPADLDHPTLGTPTHVNLKAARMGGFLPAIRTGIAALERGITPYWGGQWELGVARRQAQQIAACLCPSGPNDLATTRSGYPLVDGSTVAVDLGTPGFGQPVQGISGT